MESKGPTGATAAQAAFHAWLDAERRGVDPESEAAAALLTPEEAQEFRRLLADYEILRQHIEHGGARLSAGQEFGDYRLLQEIGRGGMGVVWEAAQLSLPRKVALKLLYPHLSWSSQLLERFRREGAASAKLSHPAIVTVFEIGEHQGFHYIAQELVAGGLTLADSLDEAREAVELPPDYFLDLSRRFAGLADALQEAHRAGVVHRDIKPGNVLLTPGGDVKIADFGLALVEDEAAITRTGEVSGTPFYMSPEQVAGRRLEVDHRTDVFSLGATLYEALTLKRPFGGETIQDVFEQILLHDPVDPRRIRSKIPRDLAVICLRCLEKKPDDRYPTMKALALDLRRFLGHQPILAKPPGSLGRFARWTRRHPVLAASGSILVISIFVVTVLLVESREALRVRSRILEIVDVLMSRSDIGSGVDLEGRANLARELATIARDNLRHDARFVPTLCSAGRYLWESGRSVEALHCLREARNTSGVLGADDSKARLAMLADFALVCSDMDQLDEARAASLEGIAVAADHAGDPGVSPYARHFRNRLYWIAIRRQDNVELARIEREYGDVSSLMRKDVRDSAGESSRARVDALSDLASVELLLNDDVRAEHHYAELLACLLESHGMRSRPVLAARLAHATALTRQKRARSADAERELRDLLDDLSNMSSDDPLVFRAEWRLGSNLIDQNRHEEALPRYQTALVGLQGLFGPHHLDVLHVRTGLVMIATELRCPAAEELALVLIEDCRAAPGGGDHHSATLIAERALVGLLRKLDRWVEAEEIARYSYERLVAGRGARDRDSLEGMSFVAETLEDNGNYAEAEAVLRLQLELNCQVMADPEGALGDLGGFLHARGRDRDALPLLVECRGRLRHQSAPDAHRLHETALTLGRVYRRLGSLDDAIHCDEETELWMRRCTLCPR